MKTSTTLEQSAPPKPEAAFSINATHVRSILIGGILAAHSWGQTPLTWEQVRTRFETANPTLKANQLNIDESRAAEITAYLRPNPDFSITADGFQITKNGGVWRPLSGVVETPGISYLHER